MIIQSIIAIFRIFIGPLSCARIIVRGIPLHIYIHYGAPCFASGKAPLKRYLRNASPQVKSFLVSPFPS